MSHMLVVLAGAAELPSVLRQVDVIHDVVKERLALKLAQADFAVSPEQLLIRVFKYENELEVWGRPPEETKFKHIHTYAIAPLPRSDLELSDKASLGPKQQSGDLRVPEGFYRLLYHNPWSQFHLSLAMGYPNAADAIRGWQAGIIDEETKNSVVQWWRQNLGEISTVLRAGAPTIWGGPSGALGNQIFIHGGSATIGCIPIGDIGIEELFSLTDPRRVGGTQVHIFPCRLTNPELKPRIDVIAAEQPAIAEFWNTLIPPLDHFDRERTLPVVRVDPQTGAYITGNSTRDDLIDI